MSKKNRKTKKLKRGGAWKNTLVSTIRNNPQAASAAAAAAAAAVAAGTYRLYRYFRPSAPLPEDEQFRRAIGAPAPPAPYKPIPDGTPVENQAFIRAQELIRDARTNLALRNALRQAIQLPAIGDTAPADLPDVDIEAFQRAVLLLPRASSGIKADFQEALDVPLGYWNSFSRSLPGRVIIAPAVFIWNHKWTIVTLIGVLAALGGVIYFGKPILESGSTKALEYSRNLRNTMHSAPGKLSQNIGEIKGVLVEAFSKPKVTYAPGGVHARSAILGGARNEQISPDNYISLIEAFLQIGIDSGTMQIPSEYPTVKAYLASLPNEEIAILGLQIADVIQYSDISEEDVLESVSEDVDITPYSIIRDIVELDFEKPEFVEQYNLQKTSVPEELRGGRYTKRRYRGKARRTRRRARYIRRYNN